MLIQGGGMIGQNIKSGELVALGVSALEPPPLYPGLPTIASAYQGFETQSWVGMFALAGTPKQVIDRLHATLTRILADPGMKARIESQGGEIIGGSTPQALTQVLRDDQAKWSKLIRDKKIAAD